MKTYAQPVPPVSPDLVWGYVRLSQEDLDDQKTTLAEKFRLRRGICLELAQRHGLPLREDQILCERASGGFLATRPEMLRLLDYAQGGKLKYLVTPNLDRILRGDKTDEARVENTFIDAGVVLITNDMGATDFGDEDYDPLPLEMQAFLARNYRRQYIKKRRQTDRSRLTDNIRSQGAPPWCYFRIASGRASYGVYPDRFEIAQELFARAGRDPYRAVVRDLNARQVPSPYSYRWTAATLKRLGAESEARLTEICGDLTASQVLGIAWTPDALRDKATARERYEQREFCRACIAAGLVTPYLMKWKTQTVREILRNPFFAGRMSRRKKTPGGRKHLKLKWTEYDISERDGDWPRVLSFADWVELHGRIGETQREGRPPRSGLLTRILHCSNGRPMCLDGACGYSCPCQYTYETHAGMEAGRPKWENWARDVVVGVLDALPLDALDWSPEVTRGDIALTDLKAQHARAVQAQAEAQAKAGDLMLNRQGNIDLFGIEAYQEAASRVRLQVEAAGREVERLGRMLRLPDLAKLRPLLQAVREVGAASLWDGADFDVRRAAVEGVIARIDLAALSPGERFYRRARVTYQDWVLECLPGHQPPPLIAKRWTRRGEGQQGGGPQV